MVGVYGREIYIIQVLQCEGRRDDCGGWRLLSSGSPARKESELTGFHVSILSQGKNLVKRILQDDNIIISTSDNNNYV